MLIALLQLLNQTEVDIDTESNMEQTNEELERGREIVKSLQESGDIKLSFDLGDETSGLDKETLQQRRSQLV